MGWLVGQLIVVFAGVSAAFVVENYRDSKNQQAEFRQALSGVIAELSRYETRGLQFADGIDAKISAWDLQKEFAADLSKLSNQAHDLRLRLETLRGLK